MTLWGNIHWSPTSIEDDLQSEVAPITNKDRFMIGRDHNLSQWGIKRFWMRPHSTNLTAGWSDSRDYQKLRYSKVECGFLNIDARATSKKIQICETLHTYLWCCIQRHIAKTDHIKVNIGTIKCSSLLCSLLSPHENCWRSVGARLQEADAISSLAFWHINTADRLIMVWRLSTAFGLFTMQDQDSFTCCWHPFLGGGSNILNSILAHKGGRYIDYALILMHSTLSICDARPKIIDTPVTLSQRRWYWYCPEHFCS